MADFLYTRPTENQAPSGTWTTTPAAADGYEASWVADERLDWPSRLSADNGYWDVDFGAARRVDLVAILAHTLVPGATVQIQAGNSSPPGTLSTTWVVPALRADGRAWNLWGSLLDVAGYTTLGYRYWRFTVAGNTGVCQIGEIWLASAIHRLPWGARHDAQRTEEHRSLRHETDGGVLWHYDLGVTLRRLRTSVLLPSEAALETLNEWYRAARGRQRPSLVIPDDSVAYDAWLAVFDDERQSWTRRRGGLREATLSFREVSAGAL